MVGDATHGDRIGGPGGHAELIAVIVYAVVDDALSPTSRSVWSSRCSIRREDAERFIEEVRGDDPEAAEKLRIEERELDAGSLN